MISEHVYTLEVVGTGHRVELDSGTVTVDESWSPYVQANLTMPRPLDSAVLEALDPRTGGRVRLSLTQRFGASDPVSVLSDEYGAYNRFPNGLPASSSSGWTPSGGETVTFISSTEGVELSDPVGGGGGYLIPGVAGAPGVGRWAAVGVDVKPLTAAVAAGWRTYARVALSGAGDQAMVAAALPLNQWTRQVVSVQQVDPTATLTRAILWPPNTTAGPQFRARRLVIAYASTKELAEAAVAQFQQRTGTVADLTAAWAGLNASGVSALYGRPYNAFGMRASTQRRFSLGVRSENSRALQSTIDLALASDEALLQDMALLNKAPTAPGSSTVRGAVQLALEAIGATLTPGSADGPVEADAVSWMPGQYAWDYVDPIVKAAGLRLWCDETGRWLLTEPLAPTEGALTLSDERIGDLDESLSRDEGWYDSVVVTYRWRDSGGVERIRYDVAAAARPSRTYSVEYSRPWPGDGAAAAILARAQGRGRVMAPSSVSNYDAAPGQALSISSQLAPTQTGLVTRVEWDMSTDTMQVRSRDLVDTPDNAWALIPSGIAWQDIPAGMSWGELDFSTI